MKYVSALTIASMAVAGHGRSVEEILAEHPSLMQSWNNTGQIAAGIAGLAKNPQLFSDLDREFLTAIRDGDSSSAEGSSHKLRALQTTVDMGMINAAWDSIVESWPATETVTDPTLFGGSDKVRITKKGDTCYVIGKESDDVGDWFGNLDLGKEPIMKSAITTKADFWMCGCKTWNWWGTCATSKTCSWWEDVGYSAYDGFVKPYNNLRVAIRNKLTTVCAGLKKFRYVGWSRGGAIATTAAFGHMRDGLITASHDVRLITFGAPKVLEKRSADMLQSFLDGSYRAVKDGTDPVPSVPPSWFGGLFDDQFYHVGNIRLPSSVEVNGPTFTGVNLFGAAVHLQYGNEYGTK